MNTVYRYHAEQSVQPSRRVYVYGVILSVRCALIARMRDDFHVKWHWYTTFMPHSHVINYYSFRYTSHTHMNFSLLSTAVRQYLPACDSYTPVSIFQMYWRKWVSEWVCMSTMNTFTIAIGTSPRIYPSSSKHVFNYDFLLCDACIYTFSQCIYQQRSYAIMRVYAHIAHIIIIYLFTAGFHPSTNKKMSTRTYVDDINIY